MVTNAAIFRGIVRGNVIELDQATSLPDGEHVTVVVQRIESPAQALPPNERLRRAFGAWGDDAESVDQFLEELRRDKDSDNRPEPLP
jgi:hypothetical protein